MASAAKIGFIGCGRLSAALFSGFAKSGLIKPQNMIASDVDQNMLKLVSKSGVKTTTDNNELVSQSSLIIIAVKPHVVSKILREVEPIVTPEKLFVSIAAGVTIKQMENYLPPKTRVIRVMPNTPALLQCGASVFSPGSTALPEDCQLVSKLFSSVGTCDTLPEAYLDSVTGMSGSGPAYAFVAIEALSDAGVGVGLPRDISTRLAAQTLMGAAKMVLETGQHPGQLKDAVCSPGGTTIAGVAKLEECGFRSALIKAVEAATLKSRELGGK